MIPLLEVTNISKAFYPTPSFSQMIRKGLLRSALPVLENVHLVLEERDLYCLMGPNGAGKTTLLKILCGLILPDSGTLRLSGEPLPFDHPHLRATLGLVTGEERSFYWRLTGRQNLEFFSSFYPIPRREAKRRIERLTELFHLGECLDKRFFTYSTGAKQLLGLCRGLLGDPKILFLDEPTRSLDPQAADAWRSFLRKTLIEKERKTILYTTHQLEEAEIFSNRIGILSRGRIVAEGDSLTLKKKAGLDAAAPLLGAFQKFTKENINVP